MLRAAALLAALAGPVASQDALAEFDAAQAAFGQAIEGNDMEAAAALIDAGIDLWEGDWVAAHILAAGGPLHPELVTRACGRLVDRLKRSGPHGFALSRVADGRVVGPVVTYEYLGFRSFQRAAPEQAVRDRLGLPDGTFLPSILTGPLWRGDVEVFHPSPDVLVIQPTAAPAEIMLRCR